MSEGEELVPTEVEVAPLVTPGQKKHKIWGHPDKDLIHAMLRRGKSPEWISLWLDERYPLVDDDDEEHPDAVKNKKMRVTALTIKQYREQFMPEVAPGVDVIREDIETIIGRRLPPPAGPKFELEMLEMGIRVGEHNLARALKSDNELGFLQPQTLTAHAQFVEAVAKTIEQKAKLGEPGYEYVPERHEIDQTNRTLSVELHGKVDPRTGEVIASEPEKLEVLRKFIELGPEEARNVMDAASDAAEELGLNVEPDKAQEVVEGAATEIPEPPEAFDGSPPSGPPGRGPSSDS